MTFDEFKALALNPPRYQGRTICKLDVYGFPDEWIDGSGHYNLLRSYSSYYVSCGDALNDMPRVYDSVCKTGLNIYCSFIYEIPTGIDMRFQKCTRVVAYDSECNLIDQTLCAFPCGINDEEYETFRGRDQNMIRFKPGDMVEVMTLFAESEPSIDTAIITKTPRTIEESWNLFEVLEELFVDGMESDEYSYLIGEHWKNGYNSSAPSYLIFKPRVPISEQRKTELIEHYNNYTGHAFWRQGGSRLDEIAQAVGGLSPDLEPGFKYLTPKDFDPIYEATEVVHLFATVDFSVESPLEIMLERIEKSSNNALSKFSNFIISITNTNWRGKRLRPNCIAEWERTIASRLPHAEYICWGQRTMRGAMYYKLDIVAYNK